jgi:23S rRNA pseudouridine2605 synthase
MIRHPRRPGPPGVSLARALSKLGAASRTQAVELIAAGRVTVNGVPANSPAQRIDMARDVLALNGVALREPPRRYLALNKPRGLVTTARDEHGRTTVYHCLRTDDKKLAPVGRLDRASEGLLLFTNDTQWAQRLLDPARHVPRTYHVQVDRLLEAAEIERLRRGIALETGQTTRPAEVALLRSGGKTCWLELTLHEGLNRQIRRMIEAVGARVLRLVRIRIGPIELGDLAKGHTRLLTEQELAALGEATSGRKPATHDPGFPPARA